VIDSPSGGAPEQAPRWDLTGTEGCGGGIRVTWYSRMFLGYMGIYRRKRHVGGATGGPQRWGASLPPWAGPVPRGHPVAPLAFNPSLLSCIFSKNDPPEGFIPFGLRLYSFYAKH